jgi:cohesin complex subunit SA-1/2
VVDLHFSSIDWIARKISGYIKQEKANKNKEAKSRLQTRRYQALTFFRPLAALLGPIAGRDAIRIKNHAEEQMEGSGAPMNGTKAWDSYKAYEKRLVGIASRDENMKNASRRLVADTQAERGARMRAKVAQDGGKGKRKAAEEEAEGELVGEDRTEGTEGHRTPSPPPATPSKKRRPAPGPARSQEDDRDAEKEQEDNQAPNHGAGGDAEQEIELDLRDFELQVEDVDMDEALGLGGEDEFELPDLEDLPNQLERERSVSVDPVPKKRRLAKKF